MLNSYSGVNASDIINSSWYHLEKTFTTLSSCFDVFASSKLVETEIPKSNPSLTFRKVWLQTSLRDAFDNSEVVEIVIREISDVGRRDSERERRQFWCSTTFRVSRDWRNRFRKKEEKRFLQTFNTLHQKRQNSKFDGCTFKPDQEDSFILLMIEEL